MISMPPYTVSRQQLVTCLIFSAGYYKFLPRSKALTLSCSCISQQPEHQRGSKMCIYIFFDCSLLFLGTRKRERGRKGRRNITLCFSAVRKHLRRENQMSLVGILNIWDPTELMYCVCFCTYLTW